ncbi:DNA polymerase III subunit gamma/tau [Spiroplasma culicicola]|uniref:DNA polymerase III subunit gamma/tau n=1 Tax=Spiroplasma culicicola AES-1 TaxID=1276246 RepID=W6A5E4_9MOLU|nr:DNA polymerase III subunit gamma/tau [Spiroplasma culicicola]AHI52348.1 DNA polymerase III subunits gamma and tau [Spiroplasma culicicola AES-1]
MENNKSLYREYRPKNLDDVAGHEGMKDILISQIRSGHYNHAMLFSGQRGTGKTSIAKILAKVINCENVQDYNPCNECTNCKEFNSNSHPDVFEMDAASNNGVDEIRNIKANVATLPALGKYKVYIIDEVHMLTNSAFNALLKTLEEPPKHIIFILATTEFSKIPQTIISRCQTYNFRKINKSSLQNRILKIVTDKNKSISQEALEEIFLLSEGSLRDALNYVEQTMLVAKSEITIDDLKKVFYISTKEDKLNIIKNVFRNNPKEIIEYFESSNNQGIDFQNTTVGILNVLKEIIEYKMTTETQFLNILDQNDLHEFDQISLNDLFTLANNISDAYSNSKNDSSSYQYILINILKTITEITTPISVFKENELVQKNEPKIFKETIEEQKTVEEVKIVEEVEIQKEILIAKEELNIENQEIKTEPVIKNDEENINSKIWNIMESENDEEKFLKLQMLMMVDELKENSKSVEFSDDQILNALINVEKETRKNYESIFLEIISSNQDNLEHLKSVICFYNIKITAANFESLIMIAEDRGLANWINQKLKNTEFRSFVFNKLQKEIAIFCIDKKRWAHIKEEYMFRKNSNTLSLNYQNINIDEFYNQIETNETSNEYLKRAREILNINIKVVD